MSITLHPNLSMPEFDTPLATAATGIGWDTEFAEADLERLDPMNITHPLMIAFAWFVLTQMSDSARGRELPCRLSLTHKVAFRNCRMKSIPRCVLTGIGFWRTSCPALAELWLEGSP